MTHPRGAYLTDQRFTTADAAQVIAEAADALDYAHPLNAIHRDIKPAHILPTPPPIIDSQPPATDPRTDSGDFATHL